MAHPDEHARITALLQREHALWEHGLLHIAGVDEAGRGPLAGPVVAAAVIFPHDIAIDEINDSKKLSAEKRDMLYDKIFNAATSVGVGVVDVAAIDRVNILNAAISAMHDAIANLSITPQYLLIDGNKFYHEHIPYTVIVDGDARCYSIAAASVIAKVTRDRLMIDLAKQFPQYGFEKHKGYGTRAHYDALRRYGLCPAHRTSFVHLESKNFPDV